MNRAWIGAGVLLLALVGWLLFRGDSWEVVNAPVSKPGVVAFGDSLTRGVGASEEMAFPAQLGRKLGVEVVNLGIPGETTGEALERLSGVLEYDAGVVLLTLGGNDLKNGISKEVAFENLRSLVKGLQASGAVVVLGGLDVPFYGKGFGDAYRELAQEMGTALVPNVFEGIFGKGSLMSDPIHPNGKGYAIMADHFYKVVQPLLNGRVY